MPARPFTLPDGNVVDMGVERLLVGEALFDPALGLGKEVVSDLDPLFKWEGTPSSLPLLCICLRNVCETTPSP